MNEGLKPCPFCGSRASRSTEKATMLRSPLRVSCSDDGCGAHYGAWHPKEWNTRAELAELKAGQGEAVAWRNFDGEGGYDYTGCEDIANRWEANNGARYAHWLEPLYTAPPAAADAVSVPRELLGRLVDMLVNPIHYSPDSIAKRAEELRALLARQEVKS